MKKEPEYRPFMRTMTSDLLAPQAKLHAAQEWLAQNRVNKRDVNTNAAAHEIDNAGGYSNPRPTTKG